MCVIVWPGLSVGGVIIPKLAGAIRGGCHLIQVGSSVRVKRQVPSVTFIKNVKREVKRQVQVQAEGNERDLARGICARARSPNAGLVCLPCNHELVILFFSRPFDLHIHTMYGW